MIQFKILKQALLTGLFASTAAVMAFGEAKAQTPQDFLFLQDRVQRLEAQVYGMINNPGAQQGGAPGATPQTIAQLSLRIDSLEEQIRTLTGQVQESSFRVQQLEEQLRRFREDTEFRFRDLQGGGITAIPDPTPVLPGGPGQPAVGPVPQGLTQDGFTGPAPGPQVLGQIPGNPNPGYNQEPIVSQPAAPGQPLDLSALARNPNLLQRQLPPADIPVPNQQFQGQPQFQGQQPFQQQPQFQGQPQVQGQQPVHQGQRPSGLASPDGLNWQGALDAGQQPGLASPQPQSVPPLNAPVESSQIPNQQTAAINTRDPFVDYERAHALYAAQNHSAAEAALRQFITDFPQHSLAGDAQYLIGETHFARSQYRDAADAFLTTYTKYEGGSKRAESLLGLALSLAELDQRDAACSSLQELMSKHGNAPETVLARAREAASANGC